MALTLADALREDRLSEFIAQQEAVAYAIAGAAALTPSRKVTKHENRDIKVLAA
jgi:hypothetical protein